MTTPFIQSGAVPDQSKWAPIFSNELFSGLFTNRNPLRDPATPYLYSKFYAATRYEAMWDGLNVEISPRLTLIRAPGHSVYNANTFPAVNDYYSYHVKVANATNQDQVRVVVDTDTAVYDATGGGKTLIYTKGVGAGQCRFLAVGNTLYMGDGVDLWQYLTASFVWQQSFSMPSGAFIADTNNNLQLALGYATTCSQISIANNTLTATVASVANLVPGVTVTLQGMGSSFLNNLSVTITAVGSNTIQATYNGGTLTESETGYVVVPGVNGTLAATGTGPTWSRAWLGLTYDGTNLWQQSGPALRVWGIPAPQYSLTAANTLNASVITEWTASTYYMPYSVINVGGLSGNIFQLMTGGTTGSAPPSTWNTTVGANTTDGACVWQCLGSAQRIQTYPYTVGKIIMAQWEASVVSGYYTSTPTQYTCFFQCVSAGTTSSAASGSLSWSASLNSQLIDGGVTWNNIGFVITRTASATSAPVLANVSGVQTIQAGNIGNSVAVSLATKILDVSGAVETVNSAGQSGTTVPNWATAAGASTTDNQVVWTNSGNSPGVGGTAAGTGAWVYSYAFMDVITNSVGPAAPLSNAITLAANSFVQVQGMATTLNTIGMINIYRSTVGQAVPFLIAQIPNTGVEATWTYNDFSPDQGSPGSTMNNLLEADLVGYNSAPPAGFVPACLHLSSIWGFVDNVLYYSAGGDVADMQGGWEAFPPVNYISFQSRGVVGWSTNAGLYVILTDSVQLVVGTAPPFAPSGVLGIGILSPNCFTLNGQSPFLYTSDKQVVGIDPTSGVTVDGFPIANLLGVAPFAPATAYLTWYVNGTDQRLFCGDGGTGYYNMLTSIPPESPSAVWSTKRTLAVGCSAIKSVETAPGVYQMLVGPPAAGGPILYRDTTSATDNGATYSAWAIVGSNVLAHHGQIAEIGFISAVAIRTGSVPQVAVLLDEVSGYPNCPPFDTLPRVENDPPKLPESKSLFSKRYYMSQTDNAAWCHHMQVRFTFANENALNELLAFTIFGAIHNEKTEAGE
jgi:hypothetical protein